MADKLHLEAVLVLQVRRVVLGAARVRVPVGKHQPPAIALSGRSKTIYLVAVTCVEGKVIESCPAPLMTAASNVRRLLDDDVSRARPPAPARRPVLEQLIAEFPEQPAPAG